MPISIPASIGAKVRNGESGDLGEAHPINGGSTEDRSGTAGKVGEGESCEEEISGLGSLGSLLLLCDRPSLPDTSYSRPSTVPRMAQGASHSQSEAQNYPDCERVSPQFRVGLRNDCSAAFPVRSSGGLRAGIRLRFH